MNYTISSCLVKSQEFTSYPNGNLTAVGTVNYFTNQNADKYNPVKLVNIKVTNQNGIAFFERSNETNVNYLRATAKALLEIADNAEKANDRMLEINKV